MGFDVQKFESTTVTFQTEKVPVPQLKDFFPEGEESVWEIKPLTGIELAICDEAAKGKFFEKLREAIEKVAGKSVKAWADGFQEIMGKSNENGTPEDYLRWIKMVELGSVPQCPEHICVKLAYAKGGMLKHLAQKIAILSAVGADLGK